MFINVNLTIFISLERETRYFEKTISCCLATQFHQVFLRSMHCAGFIHQNHQVFQLLRLSQRVN